MTECTCCRGSGTHTVNANPGHAALYWHDFKDIACWPCNGTGETLAEVSESGHRACMAQEYR
jgi:hypothetical protein